MNKEGRFQNVLIILLAVAVVGMSIGFAALQQQLTINGNATFAASKWLVEWDNSSVVEGGNATNTTVVIDNNNLNVSYDVTLKPNSNYTLTVDAINRGTFDALLTGITFKDGKSPAWVSTTYGSKIGYTFSYNSQIIPDDTGDISSQGIKLAKNGGTHPVVITLTYPLPSNETALFDEDEEIHLGVELNYVAVIE